MDRLQKIRAEMEKKGASAFLLSSEQNRFYASKFDASDSYLLITPKKAYFLSDFRYEEAALASLSDMEFVRSDRNLETDLCGLADDLKIKDMLFEDAAMTFKTYAKLSELLPKVSFVPEDGMMSTLRMVKDEEEIKAIARAQYISDGAFLHLTDVLKEGMREKEIASELECHMLKMGAEGLAFKTIALVGENASMPHGEPGDRKIKLGDMLTVDFGCKLWGYCADMTRTVALGRVSDEQRRVYDTVLAAQKACLDTIKAGMTGSECHKIAADIIEEAGYMGCFGHGLGHGVGIDIHENPRFSPKYEKKIPENAVMSVEPGIYIKGKMGVRIEDLVVVKKDGVYNLNYTPKELIIL